MANDMMINRAAGVTAHGKTPSQLEELYDGGRITDLSTGALVSVHIVKIRKLEKQLRYLVAKVEELERAGRRK